MTNCDVFIYLTINAELLQYLFSSSISLLAIHLPNVKCQRWNEIDFKECSLTIVTSHVFLNLHNLYVAKRRLGDREENCSQFKIPPRELNKR